MTESFGPEYVRPASPDCPDCECCSAPLCKKGAASTLRCAGLTPEAFKGTVANCPCSAASTRGTHAWRLDRLRVTMHATQWPLRVDVGAALHAVAAGETAPLTEEQVAGLQAHRYVDGEVSAPVLTGLGARYLEARGETRLRTPVKVEEVDLETRTARVLIADWSPTARVTVLLDQLLSETKLNMGQLPGQALEAEVNVQAADPDDVVLTRVTLGPLAAAAVDGEQAAGGAS